MDSYLSVHRNIYISIFLPLYLICVCNSWMAVDSLPRLVPVMLHGPGWLSVLLVVPLTSAPILSLDSLIRPHTTTRIFVSYMSSRDVEVIFLDWHGKCFYSEFSC